MKNIIITYQDQDINLELKKDEIVWTIEMNGKRYGKSAIIPSKKLTDIVGVVGSICLNACESINELKKLTQCKQENSSKVSKKSSK
jgi:hypothetical protein